MKKDDKIRVMCNSGDDSLFYKAKKGDRVMIGTGEHATFVRVGSRGSFEDRENSMLKRWEREEKIEKILSVFPAKLALHKIKKIMLEEMRREYYQDITNIKEVIDINTHLMEKFNCGIDYMHVENLVIWQNGFYNFNNFNFPIPASIKSQCWDCGKYDLIISKRLVYTKFDVKEN